MLPPNPSLSLQTSERVQIAKHLRTHHPSLSLAAAKDLVPTRLERWSKTRINGGDDTLHATLRVHMQHDSRDATFIKVRCLHFFLSVQMVMICRQYSLDVDVNARFRNRPEVFRKETFYGQLLDIFVLPLPPDDRLGLTNPSTTILAQVLPCNLIPSGIHGISAYKTMKTGPEVINLNTIECTVGRIRDQGTFFIIDRQGSSVNPDPIDSPSEE